MKRKSYKMEGSVTMDYVNAFWIGGLICALVQILLENLHIPGFYTINRSTDNTDRL